jgi:hypothetical protein
MNRSTDGVPCQTASLRIPSMVICSVVLTAVTKGRSLTTVSDCPAIKVKLISIIDSINILINF